MTTTTRTAGFIGNWQKESCYDKAGKHYGRKFQAYGTVLEFPENYGDTFYIADTETDQPWRVAVFRYSSKEIKVVENHPTSKESFEPLKGITVLLVAEHENRRITGSSFWTSRWF